MTLQASTSLILPPLCGWHGFCGACILLMMWFILVFDGKHVKKMEYLSSLLTVLWRVFSCRSWWTVPTVQQWSTRRWPWARKEAHYWETCCSVQTNSTSTHWQTNRWAQLDRTNVSPSLVPFVWCIDYIWWKYTQTDTQLHIFILLSLWGLVPDPNLNNYDQIPNL